MEKYKPPQPFEQQPNLGVEKLKSADLPEISIENDPNALEQVVKSSEIKIDQAQNGIFKKVDSRIAKIVAGSNLNPENINNIFTAGGFDSKKFG